MLEGKGFQDEARDGDMSEDYKVVDGLSGSQEAFREVPRVFFIYVYFNIC